MEFVLHAMLLASYAPAPGSLVDPPSSSVIASSISWLQGTLLGTIAIVVAIIAVSWIGFMMLAGRVNVRYGLTVTAGCFVLFGASTIVAGIQASLAGGDGDALSYARESAPPMVAAPPAPPAPAANSPNSACASTSLAEMSPGDCSLRRGPLSR